MSEYGYLYVIVVREFVRLKESVIKFGCTKDFASRFSQYPKGSVILFCKFVNDYIQKEKDVLKLLRSQYIQRKDLGREYFEGSASSIVQFVESVTETPNNVFEYCNIDTSKPTFEAIEICEPKIQKIKDPDLIIEAFMNLNKSKLNNNVLKSSEFYDEFAAWNFATYDRAISYARFLQGLKNNYSIESKPHHFDDGVSLALFCGNIAESECEARESLDLKNPFKEFADAFIVPDKNCHFTLKEARNLYKNKGFSQGNIGKMRKELERIIQSESLDRKRFKHTIYRNVFMGFRLVTE